MPRTMLPGTTSTSVWASLPRDIHVHDNGTGVVDFLTIVEHMMGKSWGHAPESHEQLFGLRDVFKTTPVSALAGAH